MFRYSPATALALACTATVAVAAVGTASMSWVESLAHQEEARIITSPIGGVTNRYWFNYQVNVIEAKKELSNDLRGAEKARDIDGAWDEYRLQLGHERVHYVKEMAKRGYRYGSVTVGE